MRRQLPRTQNCIEFSIDLRTVHQHFGQSSSYLVLRSQLQLYGGRLHQAYTQPCTSSHNLTMDSLLPIEPRDSTLASHLSAFDSLISALLTLPSRTRWPTHIPINGKARIKGSVIHTNDVKVCLGDGWWVEMTAAEAVEYLQRKKTGELASW